MNSGSRDSMTIYGFIFKEHNVPHLWDSSLLFPCNCEPPPGVFLFPEGVIEVEDDPPPGDLMLDGDVWVDFIPVAFPEFEYNVIWS